MDITSVDVKTAFEIKARTELSILLNHPFTKLVFPHHAEPLISIIVLTYNKVEYTYRCLESLLAHADVSYELIIVDNASTDNTRDLLARVENAHCILNDVNVYFMRGNNQGVAIAKAPYILLLNNDTEINPGTLSALLKIIRENPTCGAVGGKLIWPNGLLQEAGSIIFQDGSCLGYGRGHDPDQPEYSYVREVDYCSAACLLIDRALFKRLGGLDPYWEPAYYEDTDLCMRITQAGYKIFFQPAACIFHHEYSSSSKETAEHLMQINCQKFLQKWVKPLLRHFPNHPDYVLKARNKNHKINMLIIDDQIPLREEGRGYHRAYEMVCTLASEYQITFFAKRNFTAWQPTLYEFQQRGIEVFYKKKNFECFLEGRADYYSIVIVSRPHNFCEARKALETYLPRAKIIYDAEALFYKREQLKYIALGSQEDESFQAIKEEELVLLKSADHIIVVSENEKKSILNEIPGFNKPITIWGHALHPQLTAKLFSTRKNLLFVGTFVFEGSPNESAILYFAKQIFPLVKDELNCKLIIIGKYPTPNVLALASAEIDVIGYTSSLDEYYNNCRVFIVPHLFAGGIPFKLSEAMSRGIPSVVTPLIAEQLSLSNEVLIGKNPVDFAAQIKNLYHDEILWNTIRENALCFIKKTHDPEHVRKHLLQKIADFLRSPGIFIT